MLAPPVIEGDKREFETRQKGNMIYKDHKLGGCCSTGANSEHRDACHVTGSLVNDHTSTSMKVRLLVCLIFC